jgi:N-acetylmuramoyl-L-alanine amidase
MMVIGLDAGHGGENIGTRHYGIKEEVYTLEMAKLVKGMLEQAGLSVQMSREKDETLGFAERARRLHASDFVLVLHVNASESLSACDLRTYVLPNAELSFAVANEIERVAPRLIAPKAPQPLLVTSKDPNTLRAFNTLAQYSNKQAVLVEMFFATHKVSAEWAASPQGKAAIATALCHGCVHAWQFQYAPPTAPALV